MADLRGRMTEKIVSPRHFQIVYQCPCGWQIVFTTEGNQMCIQCRETYQLRVLVGKTTTKEK